MIYKKLEIAMSALEAIKDITPEVATNYNTLARIALEEIDKC